jgi:hypothetical protein
MAAGIIFTSLAGFLGLLLYFLPALIARDRKNPNTTAIFALNLLLGWSVIGWVVAIVWAFSGENRRLTGNVSKKVYTCPYCDEEIRPTAIKCKHCGSEIQPIVVSDS